MTILCLALLSHPAWALHSHEGNNDYLNSVKMEKPDLSKQERQWLKDHPVIRLGVDATYAPYSMVDERGKFTGAAADFVRLLGKQLGIEFQVLAPRPWAVLLDEAKRHEVDMIATLAMTPDRLNLFAFSGIYLRTPLVVMTRNNDFSLKTADDLAKRKVALVRDYSSTLQVLTDYPKVKAVMVDSPLQGMIAVATGQADAYVGAIGVNIAVASRNGISNLRIAASYDNHNGQRFGVRGDWPELAAILDKALAAIPEDVKNGIHTHWVPQRIPGLGSVLPVFSAEEANWIALKKNIRFGIAVQDEPFEFISEQGNPEGLVPEYLDMISSKAGLNFEFIRVNNRADLRTALNSGLIDMMSLQVDFSISENGYVLSDNFLYSALAVFSLRDGKFIGDLADLQGSRVALTASEVNLSLMRRHPEIIPVIQTSPLAVLQAISEGNADAGILEVSAGSYLLSKYRLRNIHMEHVLAGEETSLRVAVRNDWSVVASIFNKSMAAASPEEIAAIRRDSLSADFMRGIPREKIEFWAAISITFVLAGFLLQFYLGNKQLNAEIKRRRQADGAVKASELRFSSTFEQAAVGIALVAPDGRWLRTNKSLCNMLGYTEEELKRTSFQDITHPEDLEADVSQVGKMLAGEINSYSMEKRYVRKDGSLVWALLTVSLVRDAEDKPDYFISVVENMTKRKYDEERIEFLAYRDTLTGLPNRELFADRIDLAMTESHRSGKKLALLFLDLDHFKEVNDTLGHGVGDKLLIQVTYRLKECIRAVDTLGRHGGDEFLLIITNISNEEFSQAVTAAVDKIFACLRSLFVIETHELSITASIGIAVFPDDGRDFNTLLRKADTAMYSAKAAGRNTYYFFTEQMNLDAVEHEKIRTGLRSALERGELLLHYQPQVDMASNRIIGTEALLRWNHPLMGAIAPARFIPVAEACGLIVPIGKWVLEEACRQAVLWREAGCGKLTMAVNLSAVQFRHGDLIQTVLSALEDSGLEPDSLELELTESILVHDADSVLIVLQQLRSHGIRLSIDDFGTGYSSLSYLKRFPIDKLKVDQSFVRDMLNDPDDEAIVQSIIGLAKNLRLTTIAEGIESAEQLAALRRLGCQEYQGYYFARPMPAESFYEFFKGHRL